MGVSKFGPVCRDERWGSDDHRDMRRGGDCAGRFGDLGNSESGRFKSGSGVTGMLAGRPRTEDRMARREQDSQRDQGSPDEAEGVAVPPAQPGRTQLIDDAQGGRRERRGLWTVIGAFAICPCHLPITLALLGVALGGSAAGALLRNNVVLTGVVVTIVWAALTWRGFWLLRHGRTCPVPGATQPGRLAWVTNMRRRR